jgi:hypothetical protein
LAVLAADHAGSLKHGKKDFRFKLLVLKQTHCCREIEAIRLSEQSEQFEADAGSIFGPRPIQQRF